MTSTKIIQVRRNGGKVHLQYEGNASTFCGYRHGGSARKLNGGPVTCKKCEERSGLVGAQAAPALTPEQRQGRQLSADAAAYKPLPCPQGEAQKLVEIRRTKVLAELERIAAEIRSYATSGDVDYGHAGSMGAVLEGLGDLHMVGANYKRENHR